MTTLRKVLPFTLLALAAVWAFISHPSPINPQVAYAQTPDCSFTFHFTGVATQTAVSNLSGGTPCVNWRLTLSTTGSLSATVTFYTSPDNSTWTAVPNTVCSSTVQPPCVLQGANPMVGTQGMLYAASYGSYVRVVVSSPSGTGTGTVRGYGAKGASASAAGGGSSGGGIGPTGATGSTGPAGATGPTGPTGATGAAGATGNANGITVYSGLAGIALTGTAYFPIGGGSLASATETAVQSKVNAATTFTNFGAQLSVALGGAGGNSVALTFRKNTSDQTLTCTITDPAVTCSDTTHSFTIASGDLVDVKAVFTGIISAAPIFTFATQAGVTVVGPTGPTGPTGPAGSGGGASPSGFYLNSGSNYYVGPTFTLATLPVAGNFTWVNQLGSSEASVGNALVLTVPNTGGNSWSSRVQSIGAFTSVTAIFSCLIEPGNYRGCAILFRESATSKLVTIGPNFNGNEQWIIQRWTDDTTINTNAFGPVTSPEIFLFYGKLEVSGSNLNFYISHDGVNYIKIYSETQTTFFTTAPDQWGYSINCEGANNQTSDCKNTLLSWTTQ